MILDPALLVAIGDVFLNLSAGWFGAAVIVPTTHSRSRQENIYYIGMNLAFGIGALVFGYRIRILGL